MNWFAWLSGTGLDPSFIYDYALTFNENQLGEDDIPYFNHEFLHSMGIFIAKHRLEILKVSRKQHYSRRKTPRMLPWLKLAIKEARNYFVNHVRSVVHRKNSEHSIIVPTRNSSLRWKVSKLQRNKKPTTLMLTNRRSPEKYYQCSFSTQSNGEKANEDHQIGDSNKLDYSFSSTVLHSQDGEYWSSSIEEFKWDSMFHNMNPT